MPLASDINQVENANSNIETAFGTNSTTFALGELGGSYDQNGSGSETIDSSMSLMFNRSQLANPQDLTLGLYGGTTTGAGFHSMTFDVLVNGVDVLDQSFKSAAAAAAYFQNHVLDLGAISTLEGGAYELQVSLSETITKPGSGFYGNIIAGSAPPAAQTMTAYVAQLDSAPAYNGETITTNAKGAHEISVHEIGLSLGSTADGYDTFKLSAGFGSASLTDFSAHLSGPNRDHVSLSTADFANFSDMLSNTQFSGGNAIISAANGDKLTIDNIAQTALIKHSTDFIFHA
jgi:hypothetical protein